MKRVLTLYRADNGYFLESFQDENSVDPLYKVFEIKSNNDKEALISAVRGALGALGS